jgi:hypothetical protein
VSVSCLTFFVYTLSSALLTFHSSFSWVYTLPSALLTFHSSFSWGSDFLLILCLAHFFFPFLGDQISCLAPHVTPFHIMQIDNCFFEVLAIHKYIFTCSILKKIIGRVAEKGFFQGGQY